MDLAKLETNEANTAWRGEAPAWLAQFRSSLVAPQTRAFVDWAAARSGAGGALDRAAFIPEDIAPWLGNIAILQWDAEDGDFRYRLFGTKWADSLGRDLTGRSLSVWPRKLAAAIRDRVRSVADRRVPMGARVPVAHYVAGQVTRGQSVFEQLVWPLSYGPGATPAVMAVGVRVPNGLGIDGEALRAESGRLGHWFNADGAPLTPP